VSDVVYWLMAASLWRHILWWWCSPI